MAGNADFAGEVARTMTVKLTYWCCSASDKLAEIFINVCGDQLNENGQNFIKVLAENERLVVLPEFLRLCLLN